MSRLASCFRAVVASAMLLAVIRVLASDYTLCVYGNANMDENINEGDIAYTEEIIKGPKEETKLADANITSGDRLCL